MILSLSLPSPSYTREEFVVTEANREAFTWLDNTAQWPSGVMVLSGETGSGKSHLAALWKQQQRAETLPLPLSFPLRPAPAILLEDVPDTPARAAQEQLLIVFNTARERQTPLLFTARQPFWHEADTMPELASRLSTAVHVPLEQPDEALLEVLLHKHAADRQLALPPDVITYLLPRLPRGYAEIAALVDTLDTLSLAAGRRLSLALARQAL